MRIQFYKEVIQIKMLLLRFQSPDMYYMYDSGLHLPTELALHTVGPVLICVV